MKLIIFDTEATDLTPGQICQLSYLMADGGQVQGKNMFFTVDEMSEGAQEVHGLSMEALKELSGGLRLRTGPKKSTRIFPPATCWWATMWRRMTGTCGWSWSGAA